MSQLDPSIRNAARAVIFDADRILLLQKVDALGTRYALPGGGQDVGETLEQALRRECLEEVNAEVTIERLICIAEAFKPSSRRRGVIKHQVEFLFLCSVAAGYEPGNGPRPDRSQVDVVWWPRARLADIRLFPPRLGDLLNEDAPLYRGVLGA